MTTPDTLLPPDVAVEYFDGQQARPQAARARAGTTHFDVVDAAGALLRRVPRREVQWPERQRHGPCVAHFESGGMVQCNDHAAWDRFAIASAERPSWVVRAQQNWRATFSACITLVALLAAGYVWGLPWVARGLVALAPLSVDREIGTVVLRSIEGRWTEASALPAEQQARLRAAFAKAVAAADPPADRPVYDLRFHKSALGPNAFALPGGTMVLTDELVTLVEGREDVLVGVLAHELGHVRHRHGMRTLVQFTVLTTVTSVALGDFSSLAATAPAVLGQQAYSRDHEREADAESLRVLQAAGYSPEAMVVLFEKLAAWRAGKEGKTNSGERKRFDPGIALSSHPADEERIRFFRDAANRR